MSNSKPIFGHYSEMKITSILLFFLVPAFILMFGSIIGEDYEVVVEYISRPGPAIIISMTIVIVLQHFQAGAQVLIDDYIRGLGHKLAIILVKAVSYFLMAVGLYSVAKMAL